MKEIKRMNIYRYLYDFLSELMLSGLVIVDLDLQVANVK